MRTCKNLQFKVALLGPSYKKFLKFKDQGLFGSLNTSGTIE